MTHLRVTARDSNHRAIRAGLHTAFVAYATVMLISVGWEPLLIRRQANIVVSVARDTVSTGAPVPSLWAVVRQQRSDLRAAAPRDLRLCRVCRTCCTGLGLARECSQPCRRGRRCAPSLSRLCGTPAKSRAHRTPSRPRAARTLRDRRFSLFRGNGGCDLSLGEWSSGDPTFLPASRRRPVHTRDH